MTCAPPPPGAIAAARDTLQDTCLLTRLSFNQRKDLCDVAFDILRDARAARLGQRPPVEPGTGSVTYVTTSEFRQGRQCHRRRPRLIVMAATGPTPGDAA
jgi:hypothetical protein